MLAYRVLSVLALAAYAPYALLRSLTGRRRIGSLRGRLGRAAYPRLDGGIWVHAVSVGEVGVARSVLAELARRVPERRAGLSVTTVAGAAMAARALPPDVPVFDFPLDLEGPVRRALDAVLPGIVLLTETEIWPLFLDRAAARGIPIALVNGRLSARSHARYRLVRRWFAPVLSRISIFAMQTEEDAARVRSLGAPADRVFVTGNVKYDLPEPPPFADAPRLVAAAKGRPILVAASTGDGEEEFVLSAWGSLAPEARPMLVLAPRRPERFEGVAGSIERRGFKLLRRSRPDPAGGRAAAGAPPKETNETPVYLLDSIGELASLYAAARLAFIGGSLVPVGGHNPIEAWAAGVPVIAGPHMENFREVAAEGERSGALTRVSDTASLAAAFSAALADPEALACRGAGARRAVLESRGAVSRTADLVLPLLARGRRGRMAAEGPRTDDAVPDSRTRTSA